MAHTGRVSDLPKESLERLEEKILDALTGEDSTLVANACLLVGLAVAVKGGATKDQIKDVVLGMLEGFSAPRSH